MLGGWFGIFWDENTVEVFYMWMFRYIWEDLGELGSRIAAF
jgi:hypothetical protein